MRALSTLLAIAASLLLSAQGRERRVQTDTGSVLLHYFTTGELSTKAWTDTDNRFGHSWAYDRSGRILFERQTRRIGGHASVDFSYHPNGAVSKAEVSDAPDGGIQWYRSTTTFDPDGRQTGFTEQGMGNDGPIPGPGTRMLTRPPEVTAPAQHEQVREQRLFINEYFVVARKNCRVKLRPTQTSPAAKDIDAVLLKGDTLRGGSYSIGERFDTPLAHVAVTATNAKGRRNYTVQRVDSVQVDAEHRNYYLMVGR
jgi:hypothetical protein